MFCRVCGFRLRVWEFYRTSRSFGYGYASVEELTQIPDIVARANITHRNSERVQKVLCPKPGYCGTGRTKLTEVPSTGMNVLQNSQKFRVRVWKSCRTCRSSGYWHGCTELTEVSGRYENAVSVPRVLWYGRTGVTEVPGTGMNAVQKLTFVFCTGLDVVQNFQNFRVRLIPG